ncbi:S8 family peptidase [Paenibacillus alkalitolerans]|uniref:S8 family peptidase n=1 Tax=Paenibacillus alkalitolerans TaxID=2799335 RepID=UPI0018F449F9|nr:S8 family serine peptidase [Paenibacillus alkalitolerans]
MNKFWAGLAAAVGIITMITIGPAVPAVAAEKAAAAVNDPLYEKQHYLQQIHAPEAWGRLRGRTLKPVTVAVVDTGVDLEHPDLKERIVAGKNIVNPSKPPKDDNGHGTAVAGVIAAVSGNGQGIAGIAPNVRIMPVKSIESDGQGEEENLGEGIRYAVDNGADIVVLSSGLNVYSTYLLEIVSYAEKKGVLLVAAAGNEGKPVKYPAAYRTVLAVGGASTMNEYKASSNFGPEVDLIAPWYVYTTANGGGYVYKEGTSMAAPQAAAVAALMLGVEPDLKPEQIRQRLMQSAEALHFGGWNQYTGYGLLRADQALALAPVDDMHEPNNGLSSAKPMSVAASVSGAIQGKEDTDWFYFDAPYKGDIELSLTGDNKQSLPMEVSLYGEKGGKPKQIYNMSSGKPVKIPAGTDRIYIAVRLQPGTANSVKETLRYYLESDFHIYRDPFEDNDKAYKAYLLPERSQEVTGTFHQLNDDDWYALQFTMPGALRLKVEADTPRIDPELYFAPEGEGQQLTIDEGADARHPESEISPVINVKPGRYYVRVRNVKSLYPLPVTGEYKLSVTFDKMFLDGNEPNNKPFQATTVAFGSGYKGVFNSANDEDWFKFQLGGRSFITVEMTGIPGDRYMSYTLYNSNEKQKFSNKNKFGETEMRVTHDLPVGTYYIKLKTDAAFQDKQYQIRIRQEPVVAGFRDISGHWAQESIERLVGDKILQGYGNLRFMPNKTVTRAEAAAMLVRAFALKPAAGGVRFPDVTKEQWFSDAVANAAAAKIVRGYPDGTFRPNEPVSRAEMTIMAALATGIRPERGTPGFADLPGKHWAAGYVRAFNKKGYLLGIGDGTFRPNEPATRAEIATLIHRLKR